MAAISQASLEGGSTTTLGQPVSYMLTLFLKKMFLLISEKKREGERGRSINDERESSNSCLSHTSYWGLSLQPGHVPKWGIER